MKQEQEFFFLFFLNKTSRWRILWVKIFNFHFNFSGVMIVSLKWRQNLRSRLRHWTWSAVYPQEEWNALQGMTALPCTSSANSQAQHTSPPQDLHNQFNIWASVHLCCPHKAVIRRRKRHGKCSQQKESWETCYKLQLTSQKWLHTGQRPAFPLHWELF